MPSSREFVLHVQRSATISRSRKKRELYQLVLADIDIRTAINVADDFIDLLAGWADKKLPYHLSEAFVAYIAVSYARPFTHGRRSAVPSLPPRWAKFSDATLQQNHALMIDVRHKIFAHSDPTSREMFIIPAGVCFGPRAAPRTSYMMYRTTLPPHSIGHLRNTCVDLQRRLQDRISILMEELYAGMDLPQVRFRLRIDEGL